MTRDEIDVAQKEGCRHALLHLLLRRIDRYIRAAHLLKLRDVSVDANDEARYRGSLDLAPLRPARDLICERSLRERFSSQLTLFEDHRVAAPKTLAMCHYIGEMNLPAGRRHAMTGSWTDRRFPNGSHDLAL